MIVVFDSNIIIPLAIPASESHGLLRKLTEQGHSVAMSPAILAEVREKLLLDSRLRRWINKPDKRIAEFLDDLPNAIWLTNGREPVPKVVLDDPDDDKIIAAGIESGAEYIVSNDNHLLLLSEWHGIKIKSRGEMLSELDQI